MRVADVLKKKGALVSTVPPNARISDAVATLYERRIGAVVVSSDRKRIDGILSERDVVRALHRTGPTVLDDSVADLMTVDVITCEPDDRIDALMAKMTEGKFRHCPVEIDGALAGIVSIGDIVASRLGELESEAQAMEEYIRHGR